MTITELLDLFCDAGVQELTIYDCENEEDIFTGTYDDLQEMIYNDEIEDYEIASIDNINEYNKKLTINI